MFHVDFPLSRFHFRNAFVTFYTSLENLFSRPTSGNCDAVIDAQKDSEVLFEEVSRNECADRDSWLARSAVLYRELGKALQVSWKNTRKNIEMTRLLSGTILMFPFTGEDIRRHQP